MLRYSVCSVNRLVLACLVLGLTSSLAHSEVTAGSFARQLNREGTLRHDYSYRGSEVIYWSSRSAGVIFGRIAMRREAVKAWRSSPGHNSLLPRISRIRVSGNYVVGRGR